MAHFLASLSIALLAAPLVHAAPANTCTQFPYAQLESYGPAKSWCSSHYPIGGPATTAAPQPTSCANSDALCSVFSEIQKGAASAISALCSCIEKPTGTTTRPTCTASPVTITVTSTPAARTATVTATVTSTPPAQTSTISATVTALVTITAPPTTTTATVTATVTTTHTPTCTPNPTPPSGSTCNASVLFGGIPMDTLSPSGNTAMSTAACAQQCVSTASCQAFTFDGSNCVLYSLSTYQLELNGIVFPVNPGVAGSIISNDVTCFNCG